MSEWVCNFCGRESEIETRPKRCSCRPAAREEGEQAIARLEAEITRLEGELGKWIDGREEEYVRADKAEDALAAARERLAALVAQWRDKADGPVPTDRAIGYKECADALAAWLREQEKAAAQGPEEQ